MPLNATYVALYVLFKRGTFDAFSGRTLAVIQNEMTTKIIFTSPQRQYYVRLRNISLTVLVILVILIRLKNIETIGNAVLGKHAAEILLVFLVALIIVFVVFYFISRKKKNIGKITFTQDCIEIQIRNKPLIFKIDEISHFQINQAFIEIGNESVALINSYENWLSFKFNNLPHEYQFILDSFYHANQLADLVKYWENSTEFNFRKTNL